MKIQDLFERDIHRPINGVVKADQLDSFSVWQELDEFVVTRELTRHIDDLVAVLLSTIESEAGAAGKNGVWVSGFFGCGKSHFIKVLSYLLENNEHAHGGERRRAVEFFSDKFADAMLFADLQKVVAAPTDTILFNIDSKADHRSGRDALLQVFLKVLNEKQGYSGDHPHIAHMERHLDERSRLAVFHAAFERESGASWLQERDAWEFHRDEVIAALTEALGQSAGSVEKWVDGGADHFSLTVENFANWVKRYLDSKDPGHRIMFLADEVGQFVGNDTHLMLNLQTITEQLGTVCNGRAWVVVTSQEDLDAVLGDLKSTKQQDFSKIQGRFKTRLSLSSANVDEVIKKRLLDKNAGATVPLAAAYDGKHDILKNQLSFVNAGMSFKTYADAADFAACYPFAAYQFSLVQKVFESIRKAGATGLHLSQGERSTLDAFQSAAKQIGAEEVGALVPFYCFYPAVEGFLDTAVKRTIDQASDNHVLEPFDATVLKVLFLIRYIDAVPGSVDNLVTLCVDEIDTDKLSLRKSIEASLARLEGETLIARNGDLYFFLTNEERDIGREIKNTAVPSGAEERELGKLLFEDLLGDVRKHTYSATGRDFSFTRLCDDQVVGHILEGSLEVAFASPLGDRYGEFTSNENCCMHTNLEQARVLIRLPDETSLGNELRTYLQTESYVKNKHTGSLPDTTRRILRDRSEENRTRRGRLVTRLKSMLAAASYFARGQKLDISRTDPRDAVGDALEYLIQNAYPKMDFIEYLHPNPGQEIQSTLRANDVEQVSLGLDTPEANRKALDDLREYIRLCALTSKQIVLHELIAKRYGGRPYGWPELEVVLLVARLAVLKEVNLMVNAAPLPLEQAYDHLTSSSKQRKVVITQRESAGGDLIKKAQALGKDLFAQQGAGEEGALFTFVKDQLTAWNNDLAGYEPLARTGKYPGLGEIQYYLASLRKFVEEPDSLRFLKSFVKNRDELLELAEDLQELKGFYANQRHSWEELRTAVDELSQNRLQLEAHAAAGPALARMEDILAAPRPYHLLHQVADLIHIARSVNDQLVAESRGPAVAEIQGLLDGVAGECDKVSAGEALRKEAIGELAKLLGTATQATSIAHIAQARQTAEVAFDRAMTVVEEGARDSGQWTVDSEQKLGDSGQWTVDSGQWGRPEILDQAADVDLPGLNRDKVVELKLDGTQDEELYRMLLKAQCNALHEAMPFLFERIGDETELLLPANLLHTDSLIRQLVEGIDESAWEEIEIIGWLYQFYISEKKDQVIGKVVKSEDIPAATQLFTPNWIVKYIVQNSLGAQWLTTYPQSPLKGQMEYYIEPAEQTDEVEAQLRAITPSTLNPEELTLIDPACGSGHILVEGYELFKAIYLERGYRQRDVAQLILEKNLFGLDIDGRAAQLTGFALMMKGRGDDRRLFERGVRLNVMAMAEGRGVRGEGLGISGSLRDDVDELVRCFEHATTFGSLIQVPEGLKAKLAALRELSEVASQDLFVAEALKRLGPLVRQAEILAGKYDAVVANPPYMGGKFYCAALKEFVNSAYKAGKADLYGAFSLRNIQMAKDSGHVGMITIPNWMFLASFEELRNTISQIAPISNLVHIGRGVWGSDFGSCSYVLRRSSPYGLNGRFLRLFHKQGSIASNEELERRFHANPRFSIPNADFEKIPGSPVAYWVPASVRQAFSECLSLSARARPLKGMFTGDNERFVRFFWEVASIKFGCVDHEDSKNSIERWYPYLKGGDFRKWYGNNLFVVNFYRDGVELKASGKYGERNSDYYFMPCITWSDISVIGTFSARHCAAGFLTSSVGCGIFSDEIDLEYLAGLLCAKPTSLWLQVINPTVHANPGDLEVIPLCEKQTEEVQRVVRSNSKRCIEIGTHDWDAYERSWDFASLPLLSGQWIVDSEQQQLTTGHYPLTTISSSYTGWITQNRATIAEMKRLEEENNRLFIDAYGLADELTPDVPIEQITLTVNPAYRYGKRVDSEQWTVDSGFGDELEARFCHDTMKELISYAVGCMMGRYRLDRPGLIYAHAGNKDFDAIYEGEVNSGQWTVDSGQ